jgi:uncharacterized iron-regulated membrane protein
MTDNRLYITVWRWHFYAGLFVLPFVMILALTGSIYLFKPQIDRWEEAAFRNLRTQVVVSADAQLMAAMDANPGSRFNHYRLPENPGDAAMIQLVLGDGRQEEVYVSPQGQVLGSLDPQTRFSSIVARIHGTLLLGKWGDWLVELAASWTIVMVLTGLYLWWPRPFNFAGTLWPRLHLKNRLLLKDLHRVTGFWISGLVLVMLISGLPWAGVWGSAFKLARAELGLINGPQNWKLGAAAVHEHVHSPMTQTNSTAEAASFSLPLSIFVAKAEAEHMAFPVLVVAPHAHQRFGPPTGHEWTVKSEAQNRPLARSVTYDPSSGAEMQRTGFADMHVVDRVVNYGVAWHEGQLFGVPNQVLGVITALSLIAISVFGVLMWLRRRPRGTLGAPITTEAGRTPLLAMIVTLAIVLPLFGLSLIVVLLVEHVWLRRSRKLSTWLGLGARS